MTLRHIALRLTLALAALPFARAQQVVPPMRADADPSFEVAAITLSDPQSGSSGFQIDGRRVTVLNESVQDMLIFAYGLQKSQIVGAPAWLATDRYDIRGVPDVAGEPNADQLRGMVRKVLAERYDLRTHDDHRELLCYVLHLSKDGPKLQKTTSGPTDNSDQTGDSGRVQNWRFTNTSLQEFAQFLQFMMDRPVVDGTALPGKFDFHLKWVSDRVLEREPEAGESLFTAMPEQIGIRIDTARAQVRVLVLDHLARPTPN